MTASGSSVIKKGSSGAEVTALQNQLNQLGYVLTVDGSFGEHTELAVKHLQKAFGYTVDGAVGDGTRFLINQQAGLNWKSPVNANTLADWAVTLKKGSSGDGVAKLQKGLAALGYSVEVDGKFGSGTEDAVKHLQQAFGYTVDGDVGEATHFLVHQQVSLGWKASK
jgi:peptidoglycan hydrolase-like protein with peptidoglycan-binding domain